MVRFVRFLHNGAPRYGVINGAEVAVIEPHPFAEHRPTGETVDLADIRLLAPVIPSKIIGVGRSYADQTHRPGDVPISDLPLFLKPSSSVIGPGEAIRLPTDIAGDVHFEGELAVVVGALLQRVGTEQAAAGILGYTCANDLTVWDTLQKEGPSLRAKAFDSFCPLGPAITNDLDPSALALTTSVDGEVRQDGTTADLLVDVATMVSEISQVMTLLPSDVILTGTPAGTGPLQAGQRVRVEIEGIGALENPVVDRDADPGGPRSVNGSA